MRHRRLQDSDIVKLISRVAVTTICVHYQTLSPQHHHHVIIFAVLIIIVIAIIIILVIIIINTIIIIVIIFALLIISFRFMTTSPSAS